MIKCSKCGNEKEFAVVVASVFNVYVDGDGKTFAKESLTDACTGIDRVECTMCRSELDDVGYDIKSEEAFLYTNKYAQDKMIRTKRLDSSNKSEQVEAKH
jgi:hypothetical protein